MIVNPTTRRSFTNPNLVAIADRLNTTAKPQTRTWFSHLPARPELAKTASISVQPVTPTKTVSFKSSDSVFAHYGFQSVRPPAQPVNLALEIDFKNPLPDEIDSALMVVFVCSRYGFCRSLFNEVREVVIVISNADRSIQLLNPVSDRLEVDAFEKVQRFLSFLQFLNISISEAKRITSLEELQSFAEEFSSISGEDIVFSLPIDFVPPDAINVTSISVCDATDGASSLESKYLAQWGIAFHNNHFFPIIIRPNGEVDVLHFRVENNRFGSIKSLIYSGSQIQFICYSIRPHECPQIKLA
jgi:hypothetical protein